MIQRGMAARRLSFTNSEVSSCRYPLSRNPPSFLSNDATIRVGRAVTESQSALEGFWHEQSNQQQASLSKSYTQLPAPVREAVVSAIQQLQYRVTQGDVIAATGLSLADVDHGLKTLAYESHAVLQVPGSIREASRQPRKH